MTRIFGFGLSAIAGPEIGASRACAAHRQRTADRAREIVQPFYDLLNGPSKKDMAGLLARSTTEEFQSYANEEKCRDRAYLAARFKRSEKIIPDLHRDRPRFRGRPSGRRAAVLRPPPSDSPFSATVTEQ